jgi:breakpoint cluster region protein
LSSSDTDGLSGSPSFGRENSTEDESNYVNIQYFLLRKDLTSGAAAGQSDDELEAEDDLEAVEEVVGPVVMPATAAAVAASTLSPREKVPDASEAERLLMYRCILNSIVESEAIYLEGLSVMLQYMKAMKVTLSTPQPVIPKEDFDVIFYKIPDLHDLHFTFHENLKRQVERFNGTETIGHNFKMLASRMKIYAAFLSNYQKALEALHKCSAAHPQFADLTRSIKLRTVKGQKQGQSLSLEDLLHKPVARVQKHCLVLQVTEN